MRTVTAREATPADRTAACVDYFAVHTGLLRISAGSASALWISRPAQASLALQPAGSLDRQKRPLSRGFDPSGCPSKPLVSYQINRQLSGRNPPTPETQAFGAHRNEPNSPKALPVPESVVVVAMIVFIGPVDGATTHQGRSPFLRLAAVEIVERKEDLVDLPPQRVFVAAEPVDRARRQIGQTQKALREMEARIGGGFLLLRL